MRRLLAVLAVTLLCALAVTAVALAKTAKFTFEGVTFSDGTSGTILAGSKETGNGSTFTVCNYADSGDGFLGQFESPDFFSADPDAVRQFCLDHFVDRFV